MVGCYAVAALSTKLSTAALDKHPQSKERGITLDLGFSSFSVPLPERLSGKINAQELQFTLVDCPGHASLIRTIIGGAQIIDLMMLVVDVTKGVQVPNPRPFCWQFCCKRAASVPPVLVQHEDVDLGHLSV